MSITRGDGLYDDTGKKVDILYRHSNSMEDLLQYQDSDGRPIGLWLIELVRDKKVFIINPPSSFLLQNKAVHSVI